MVDQYYLNSRSEMADFLPPVFSKTLEIGCGAGVFSDLFLRNAERWGVEPDEHSAALAFPKLDKLLIGAYENVADQIPAGYFDLIVCNDVIEHMTDHDRFLKNVATKLRSGGYIVGSVPNIRHFTALIKLLVLKDWPYADDGILDRTHLRFFTSKSLRRTFTENGYEIERIEGIRSIVKEGITGLSMVQNLAARAAAATLIGLSLGYWMDTQYPQIAFRLKRP